MDEGDSSAASGVRNTKHGKVMVGELPSGFLQITSTAPDHLAHDAEIAQQIAAQQVQQNMMRPSVVVSDRLFVSVVEAKLAKNYGIVKMDPYCRLRIGHNVYETETAYSGAKNPRWTKSISVPYSQQIQTIYLEIFDERSMTTDCRIAWKDIAIPSSLSENQPVDEWWPLNGKLGEEEEGTVHLLLTKKKVQQQMNPAMPVVLPQYGVPQPLAGAYYPQRAGQLPPPQLVQPHQGGVPVQAGPVFTEEDVKRVKELFPDVEDEVIKTVLEASRGNIDAAINSLLSMQ